MNNETEICAKIKVVTFEKKYYEIIRKYDELSIDRNAEGLAELTVSNDKPRHKYLQTEYKPNMWIFCIYRK